MSAQFRVVAEDFTNRQDSWIFTGLYRNNSGAFRVVVKDNAYADQSRAQVFSWGVGGWNLVDDLPIEYWHETAPSYTKHHLDRDDEQVFRSIAHELLSRLAHAMWGTSDGINLSYDEVHLRYLELV